jgi:hypothetical protein
MTTLLFNPTTKEVSIHSNCPIGSGSGYYRYVIGTNTEFALSNYNDPALSVEGDVELFILNLGARHKAVLRRWDMGGHNPNVTVCSFDLTCDDGRIAHVTQTTTHKSYKQNHVWWHVILS